MRQAGTQQIPSVSASFECRCEYKKVRGIREGGFSMFVQACSVGDEVGKDLHAVLIVYNFYHINVGFVKRF